MTDTVVFFALVFCHASALAAQGPICALAQHWFGGGVLSRPLASVSRSRLLVLESVSVPINKQTKYRLDVRRPLTFFTFDGFCAVVFSLVVLDTL